MLPVEDKNLQRKSIKKDCVIFLCLKFTVGNLSVRLQT